MNAKTIGLPDNVQDYVVRWGVREAPLLTRLREETASHPRAVMQIAPEQGALFQLLVELLDARNVPRDRHVHRVLVAGGDAGHAGRRADGLLRRVRGVHVGRPPLLGGGRGRATASTCGSRRRSRRWTRCSPRAAAGRSTSPSSTPTSRAIPPTTSAASQLVRPGGLVTLDNVLWSGDVADPRVDDTDTMTLRQVNETIAGDPRVHHVMLPIADGMTIARKL